MGWHRARRPITAIGRRAINVMRPGRGTGSGVTAAPALVHTVTGYSALNEVITRTKAKEAELFLMLKYPQLPLHTNSVELGLGNGCASGM